MALSRAESTWLYLQPEAAASTAIAIQPKIDDIDRRLKEHIEDLQEQLDLAKEHIQDLETAMAEKAPLVHTHSIGQITNLTSALTQLQTRVTSLEARVTALEGA